MVNCVINDCVIQLTPVCLVKCVCVCLSVFLCVSLCLSNYFAHSGAMNGCSVQLPAVCVLSVCEVSV